MGRKTTRYVVQYIASMVGLSHKVARIVLQCILERVELGLINDGKFVLRGFGTFYVKRKKARRYRNPRTGELRMSMPSVSVAFKPSESFSKTINGRREYDSQIKSDGEKRSIRKEKNVKREIQGHSSPQTTAAERAIRAEGSTRAERVTVQEIISVPNKQQKDDLRIGYITCEEFNSDDIYPVVVMPKPVSFLKLPRLGRSNIKGYKETDFIDAIRESNLGLNISDRFHLAVPYRRSPYEPDIVLYDESIGLYIDVEIDEPYDGYSRVATHTIEGYDSTRNVFFKESGWIVVRFTEKQVHLNCNDCIGTLKCIIDAIKNGGKAHKFSIPKEKRWDRNQAVKWERELYREQYLGITSFTKCERLTRVVCIGAENEGIEKNIERSPVPSLSSTLVHPSQILSPIIEKPDVHEIITPSLSELHPPKLSFDEGRHIYSPKEDKTGNSDSISVTTLIDNFFPYFDQDAYIKKKMAETGKPESVIKAELQAPSDRGTYMHKQIENFLKGECYDSSTKEFKFFLNFYHDMIVPKKLTFDSAELAIELPEYNISGTVDALFQKSNGEYVMIDWKRSKHLIIDGYPKKYGFGRGLSVLSHLDNSSYYKYELQQSFYKFILEEKLNIRVSSMILAVLHPDYDKYYVIKLSEYRKKEVIDMIEAYEILK